MDIQSIIGGLVNYFISDNRAAASPNTVVAGANGASASASASAETSVVDDIWNFFDGRGEEIMASTYTDETVGVPGCTSNGTNITDVLGEDGDIPLNPPDGGYTTPDSPDAEVNLPEGNEGEPILPNDVWFSTDCEVPEECNTGSMFYEESANLILGTGPMVASGMQNVEEFLMGCAIDSTLIGPGAADADYYNPDVPQMPAGVCLSDMIDITFAQEDEFATYACPETIFNQFLVCPDNENNRLPLYLAELSISCFNQDTTEIALPVEVSTITYATPEQLEADPANGESLASYLYCADDGPSFFNIVVPQQCYHSSYGMTGFFDGQLSIKLYLDNMQAVDGHVYQTYLRCRAYIASTGEE